ncbi:unnamed protein product [Citrullus colocynthis]|uniref:Uncharacterized protein n=1 Tax=Citrullus colocynthis TaxID=252529 RepID=A0ABP0YLC2_9ROSI
MGREMGYKELKGQTSSWNPRKKKTKFSGLKDLQLPFLTDQAGDVQIGCRLFIETLKHRRSTEFIPAIATSYIYL